MKVLDLQCGRQHTFEGWFGSEDDFQSQLARSLVECPVCGDTGILKRLSAPRLNLGAVQDAVDKREKTDEAEKSAPSAPTVRGGQPGPAAPGRGNDAQAAAALQAAWFQAVRHVMANTEDVGGQFAEEARKIHYGEANERNIRGQATAEETAELLDEGIAVMPLPIPKALKGPLQ